jgi:hypothetical protein
MEQQESQPPQDPSTPDPAVPPVVPPHRWEDFEGFRETFLLHVTDPQENETCRAMARMLYHLVLEAASVMPAPPEGWVRTHVRAAVADLRFLQGFLTFLGEELRTPGCPPDEEDLCRTAARKARSLGRIADVIEGRLGAAAAPV